MSFDAVVRGSNSTGFMKMVGCQRSGPFLGVTKTLVCVFFLLKPGHPARGYDF